MNILSDIGDALSGGKLVAQSGDLPYGEPLEGGGPSPPNEARTYAIAERPISFTGEDFDVRDVGTGDSAFRVRGAMLHLPGKDKLRLIKAGSGEVRAEMDRKLVAMTPTYDIYRGNGQEKIGWIEKAVVALTDTFEVHLEGKGGFGPFKPPAAYRVEGDFVDRNFAMKNDRGEVVAKFSKDGWIQFDAFNHYQVQVAPGMDAGLVVACACAIDEEFDEEHRERKMKEEQRKEEGGGGGWFG